MQTCQNCKSERVLEVSAKCSDTCSASFNGVEHQGYVPESLGIDDGEDYVYFKVCLECGQMQGVWPKPNPNF